MRVLRPEMRPSARPSPMFLVGSSNVVKPDVTIAAIVPCFLYLGAWSALAGFAYAFIGFETKGRSIEEIDRGRKGPYRMPFTTARGSTGGEGSGRAAPSVMARASEPPGGAMNADTAARSDLDALTVLNLDYIHSVQHGDVQRFEEILAEDFLCSNPDASLVDKKQFLAQTARPVTISGLSAQEVRVRILGDVAIIHARTSYTTADGEQRNGRYTDVWARRDGRWLAVSAHVTR